VQVIVRDRRRCIMLLLRVMVSSFSCNFHLRGWGRGKVWWDGRREDDRKELTRINRRYSCGFAEGRSRGR